MDLPNIYTVLEEIDFETHCDRVKHLAKTGRLMPEQSMFSVVQKFYENLLERWMDVDTDNSKLAIQLVSQQRELLRAYEDFKQQPHHDGAFNADEFIEMFLARNSG